MLQNLSEEIRELRHAEECKRRAKTTLSASAIQDYLDMEQRWLALARSYEFTEMLSSFTEPFARAGSHFDVDVSHPRGAQQHGGKMTDFAIDPPIRILGPHSAIQAYSASR